MNVKSRKPTLNLIGNKKKKDKHSECQKSHFKKRMFERVGYWITDEDYNKMIDQFPKSFKFLYQGTQGGVYIMPWRGIELKVVFDLKTMKLVTVLPL